MGLPSADMNYEDLAFSHKNAFIGFTGVTSEFGLPVNKLGVAYFLCAPLIDSDEQNGDIFEQHKEDDKMTQEEFDKAIAEAAEKKRKEEEAL